MKPRSVSATTSPFFTLPFFLVLVLLMFTQYVLARTDRPFHEVSHRAQMASNSQKVYKIDNKVLRATLIHRDHPDSPLSPGNTTTLSERFAAAVKRTSERRGLIERKLASTDFESPVEMIGEFVMKIVLGTPAQTFTNIMDTGSDLVWVQCTPCIHCYTQNDALFDTTASTSYSVSSCNDALCSSFQSDQMSCDPNCHYNYSYSGGDITAGHLSRDIITVTDSTGGSTAVSDFGFGCSNENQGFNANVDGIVGLGQGSLSLNSQLAGQSYSNIFSYCLVPYTMSTTSSSNLLLGSTASATKNLVLTYVPMLNNQNGYYVPMVGITINGNDLGLSASAFQVDSNTGSGGVIIDSGTTFTLLSSDVYNTVLQNLQNAITNYQQVNGQTDLCYDVTGVENPTFPTVAFQFTGTDSSTTVQFQLSDSSLFFPADTNTRCLAMQSTTGTGIIGYIQQANYLFEFDNVHKQIGWAQTTC